MSLSHFSRRAGAAAGAPRLEASTVAALSLVPSAEGLACAGGGFAGACSPGKGRCNAAWLKFALWLCINQNLRLCLVLSLAALIRVMGFKAQPAGV